MNRQEIFFLQDMELNKTNELENFFCQKKLLPVGKLLQKLYSEGGNRSYLASIYNAVFSEGKFAFLVNYYGLKDLFSKDNNLHHFGKDRKHNVGWSFFMKFLLHAHNGNFLHILQVVKITGENAITAEDASTEDASTEDASTEDASTEDASTEEASKQNQLSHRELVEIVLGGEGASTLKKDLQSIAPEDYLILMLSYPPLLNCACIAWGRETIALQKSRLLRHVNDLKNYIEGSDSLDKNKSDPLSKSLAKSEIPPGDFLVASARQRARSLGLMAKAEALPPPDKVGDKVARIPLHLVKLKEKMDRCDYEFLAAKVRYNGLLEQAKAEENKRLEQEGDDPILIQNAVMSAIKVGQQRRKMEDSELDFLRSKQEYWQALKKYRTEEEAATATKGRPLLVTSP